MIFHHHAAMSRQHFNGSLPSLSDGEIERLRQAIRQHKRPSGPWSGTSLRSAGFGMPGSSGSPLWRRSSDDHHSDVPPSLRSQRRRPDRLLWLPAEDLPDPPGTTD
jgi:hypothetical protein